jgi:DNA-binding PadR family transcriptional regulator
MKKTEFVLDALNTVGKLSIDFIDAMMSDRATSYRKLRQMTNPFYYEFKSIKRFNYREKQAIERQKFYNLLYKLQKQGLVKKCKKDKNSFWIITHNGKKKLKKIKQKEKVFNIDINYKVEKDNDLKIIIFDIPEKNRKKRDWLRRNLLALDFSKLQRSVWMGGTKLPEEFLKELKNLSLMPYIEIFSVNKKGTIGKRL